MNRIVSTLVSILVATTAVAVVDLPRASAQMPADALGKPRMVGELPPGTVTVRVIAGSMSSPVVGADVTMLVNDQPRTARTDAAGRATFAGLPVGAMVQAKIIDENKKEVASDPFAVPAQGGARMMMSTKPLEGGGAMMAGPAAGMPEGRAVSGQPQPDRMTSPGTYTVRVTYNSIGLKDGVIHDPNPPVDHPVALAAYAADDSIKVLTAKTNKEGVAVFDGLDTTGGTSYFALTTLPRNNATDRLIAVTTVFDSQAGQKVVLSGEKREATLPPVDDYGKLIPRDGQTLPAGKVRITLDGVPEPGARIELYDAATMKTLATAPAKRGPADPTQVRGSANFNPVATLPAQTLDVEIRGGMGTALDALTGIEIKLVSAATDQPIEGVGATTGMDGKAQLKLPAPLSEGVKAVFTINGKQMVSSGMDLTDTGGKLEVTAQWPATGKLEAVFDVAPQPGQVLFAQTISSQQMFRSLPFQTAPEAGMHANIYVYPRTLFTFDTHSFVEDQLLAIQGTFEITNYAWAPYKPQGDSLLIKLPKGHKGSIVAPQDQADVSVAQGEGFRVMRPIPPGGRKFRMGYSMPIEDGEVDWSFELPMGSWASEMKIRQTPGMTVKLPADIKGETQMAGTGEPWFVITNMTIDRGKTLTINISGFPSEAAWKKWLPRIMGVLVLLTIMGGVGFALFRTGPTPAAETTARRTKLLDELVELEKRGVTSSKDRHRREQLVDELERLWGS